MARSKQEIKFVYAVKSAAFPGLIKIGRTQNMRDRLSQLNTSCAPAPFVVVTVSQTLDYVRDERMAHDFFSSQRMEGEFFSVPESEVIDFFKTIQGKFDAESSQPLVADPAAEAKQKAQVQAFKLWYFCELAKLEKLERERNVSRVTQAELDSAQHQGPVAPILDDLRLKRKREQEDRLFDMEMEERELGLEERKLGLEERELGLEERKLGLEERKLQHNIKLIEQVSTAMRAINSLKDWANVDECTKMQATEHIKNILFNKMVAPPEYPSAAKRSCV